jgi:hypothetical protein
MSDNVTWIAFSLSYLSGRYTEKQQYPINGISDLLSDFGGYHANMTGKNSHCGSNIPPFDYDKDSSAFTFFFF